jgi:hypothetical protein
MDTSWWLPYVRMVALTGSLAVLNLSQGADMDYMVVTQPGRFVDGLLPSFGRMMHPFGHTICVNLLVSEDALFGPSMTCTPPADLPDDSHLEQMSIAA